MNKFITIMAAMAFSTSALAITEADTSLSLEGSIETTATAGSRADNQGNEQNITFTSPAEQTSNVRYSGTQTVKNVPSMGGSNLTASNDTCMGSTSAGVAVAGFGLNIGSTWTDKNCTMLKNSRELWNMGMRAASLARMCMDALNKEALELTGFVCPTKKEAK